MLNCIKSIFYVCIAIACLADFQSVIANEKPNILWLTSEDNGPDLGCYGDEYSTTPNLDRFASRALRYDIAWSTVPVCAPARTCLITGMYPSTIGSLHMRSMVKLDEEIKPFPVYLQQQGYYCTNNRKEDYNFKKPKGTWNESSNKAHWRNRKDNQPFFAVFNHTISHESKIRNRPHELVHDPAKVRVPKYHPDLPEVRRDWAQYYDRLTEMDAQVGNKLDQLEKDGLVDKTIVFYFADHGCGMPRHKRSVTNSGLHVPLIIYIPEKFKHLRPEGYVAGGSTNRMVSFVDFAPTVLSLAGIQPPKHMQGLAFLGKFAGHPKQFLVGMRGRMDERIDYSRSVRDERYLYIRHYFPHLPEGQHLHYQMQTPTTRVWHQAFQDGKLNDAQKQFWLPKPRQALFDLKNDPDQVHNLVDSQEHKAILEQMHVWLLVWQIKNQDLGFVPEIAQHRFAEDRLIYKSNEKGTQAISSKFLKPDEQLYQLLMPDVLGGELKKSLGIPLSFDANGSPSFRFWELNNCLMTIRGTSSFEFDEKEKAYIVRQIKKTMDTEPYPEIGILQCEILGSIGNEPEKNSAIKKLIDYSNLDKNNLYTAVAALNAIDRLGGIAKPYREEIKALPTTHDDVHSRMDQLVPRLVEKILNDLAAFE